MVHCPTSHAHLIESENVRLSFFRQPRVQYVSGLVQSGIAPPSFVFVAGLDTLGYLIMFLMIS